MAQQVWQDLDFIDSSRLLNVPFPLSSGEPATKQYVDELLEGLKWKEAVKVASQSNLNLSVAPSTVDGITLSSGDRVLVKAQTDLTQNGIYLFDSVSNPLVRSLDANSSPELQQAVVSVIEGTDSGITFRQSNILVSISLGTDDINWEVFGTSAPTASESTAGIAEIATQSEVNTGTDDTRFVTPLKLASYAGLIRKYVATIGDGSATSFTLNHDLDPRDVEVSVYRNSGNYDNILVEVRRPTVNSIAVVFSSAPSISQFNVVVIG